MTEEYPEAAEDIEELPLDEPPEEEGDNSQVTEYRGDEQNG